MRIGFYLGKVQRATHGGGHTFEVNFIDSLLKYETNHEIYVYYDSKGGNAFESTDRVKFINLRKEAKGFYFIPCVKKNIFSRLVEKDKIDFVYYCTPKFAPCEKPYAFTVWDLGHRVAPYFPEVSRKRQFFKREEMYNNALPRASKIVIGTNDGKNDICTYYNISSNKVEIIEMPTPMDVFNLKEDDSILDKLNLEKNGYIYYPAQFWAHKNHYMLVQTLKLLKDKGSNLKLVFTGSNQGNMDYIKAQVKELNLENEVIFAGFVTRNELISLYKNAFGLTYASLLGPDNIPPLEAMAVGCPVFISNLQGHVDQLGTRAVFFDPMNPEDLAEKILTYQRNDEWLNLHKDFAYSRNSDFYMQKVFKLIDEMANLMSHWYLNYQ